MTHILSGDYGAAATCTAIDTRPAAPNTVTLRRFLAALRRPAYHVELYELVGGAPVPIPLPNLGPKQGTVTIRVEIDAIVIVFTGRAPGDDAPGAPFQVWEHTAVVAGIYPVDLAAAVRLRAVARRLQDYVPVAADALAPYAR